MSKNILLLYPYQLYPADLLPGEINRVVMIEDPLLFGSDKKLPGYFHKQKLVFHRASMRRYVEEVLWPAGYDVEYVEFHQMGTSSDIVNKLVGAQEIYYFDLTDDLLQRRLSEAVSGLEGQPVLKVLESPNFYLTRNEAKNFFIDPKNAGFARFYQWQRERFNILMSPKTYKPLGGKLGFDSEGRRLDKDQKLPSFQVYGSNKYVEEAKKYVLKYFPDNIGEIDDFVWPTNSQEATGWLDAFIESRLDNYGLYEDALDGENSWLYHSAISVALNAGMLSPVQVVGRALQRHEKEPVPLESIENFVRQVLGWREYIRGVYLDRESRLRTSNNFGHNRRLTNDWYRGTTGIPPVDDVIKKTLSKAYAHHNERLMIVGNIMFLCDFHPDEVYRWFKEMFIDAYDWALVPNVYGMSQFADGGSMTDKPFVSSSNYILKLSHYERGDWCDIWDGLYWRFIEKNRKRFEKHPRLAIAVRQMDGLSEARRRVVSYRAEDFLNAKTAA